MSISYSSGRAYIDSRAGGTNHKLEAARRYARARKKEELDALRRNVTMTVRGVRKPAYPELALNGQQIATLIRRIQDPKGGDPKKLGAKLRAAGYEITYVAGADDPAKAPK